MLTLFADADPLLSLDWKWLVGNFGFMGAFCVFMAYLAVKYIPQIVDSHKTFLASMAATQDKQADALIRLAEAIDARNDELEVKDKHHRRTHRLIGYHAQALEEFAAAMGKGDSLRQPLDQIRSELRDAQ